MLRIPGFRFYPAGQLLPVFALRSPEGCLLPEEILKKNAMDPEELKKEWLWQNEKICICKGIPRKRFIEVINAGASSLAEVNRLLGSGGGDCKGERCGPKIERLLAAYPGFVDKRE